MTAIFQPRDLDPETKRCVKKEQKTAMSADDKYMDDLDKYNIDQDKYETHTHSGKGRSKKEAEQHHHEDPGGHTRKDVQKLVNNAHKQAEKTVGKK